MPDSAATTLLLDSRTRTRMVVSALTLLFFACYFGVIGTLFRQFWSNDVYTHGFLIPFISFYLIVLQRDKILQAHIRPNLLLGIPVLAMGLLLLVAGELGGVLILQEFSLLVTISGLVLLMYGGKVLRSTWFGIAYLLFMIPAWEILTDPIQFPFQLMTTNIAVKFLDSVGIPIFQDGVYIELPKITLEVARECSGVNYLISVLAVGFPLSYIYISKWSRRAALIVSAMGIAILGNGLRVIIVSLFAYKSILGYNGDIHGPMHLFQSLFVSAIGYIAIFIGLSLLKDRNPVGNKPGVGDIRVLYRKFADHARGIPATIALSLLLLAGILLHFYRPHPVPLSTELHRFPYRIAEWSGRDSETGFPEFRLLGVDEELSRTYELPSGERVALYVGYYDAQRQGKEIVNYKVDYLFDKKALVKVRLNDGEEIEVNRHLFQGEQGDEVALYWIDIDGRILRERIEAKLYTMLDAMLHRRSNGAVVLVTTKGSGPVDPEAGTRLASEFLRNAYPILRLHLEN